MLDATITALGAFTVLLYAIVVSQLGSHAGLVSTDWLVGGAS